ncbi:MAG: FtsX-like permease family protein [Bacteroidales bacterium]|nr:FtsX-like permease family protein [Bacteroidales bacterium]
MVADRFISRKLTFQGNVAAVAIAVSFFVIIVAVAVSSGFRYEIRKGVAAMAGDVTISPFPSGTDDPESLPVHLPEEEAIRALPGVLDIQPVAVRAGIVKNGETVHGVIVKGIPDRVGDDGADRPSLQVSIPQRLSEILGVGVGDDLTTYFVGEKLRVRKFQIGEVHRDLLELDDNLLVYANLEDIQRLNGWTQEEASSLEVTLREGADANRLALNIGSLLEDYYVTSSRQRYPQVFDWLNLLDYNVVIILILMTVVAGFNMVSGLLIMLLRNISTVGTLKTLGMDNRSIGRLFVRIGAKAVLKGMLIGNAAALLFCLLQGTLHLIPLDPVNYFVSWVPVRVNILWILGADAAAFLGILLLLWAPTRVIARIDPAQTVKAD